MILLALPLVFILLFVLTISNEDYLLETGKFRLFHSWFFRLLYRKDIAVVLEFFSGWTDLQRQTGIALQEGFHPYDIYYTLSFKWRYERFEKAMRVCLYCGLLDVVKTKYFKKHINLKTYAN